MLGLDQIHFVNQSEDVGVWRELFQGLDDGIVGVEIAKVLTIAPIKLSRFDVKNVDEDPDLREYRWLLPGKIILGEGILTAFRCRLECWIAEAGTRGGTTYPPQSQRFKMRLPKNLMRWCSTSMVAPSRRTSFATWLLKMILRIDVLPEPLLPMSKTFFFFGLSLSDSMVTQQSPALVWSQYDRQ